MCFLSFHVTSCVNWTSISHFLSFKFSSCSPPSEICSFFSPFLPRSSHLTLCRPVSGPIPTSILRLPHLSDGQTKTSTSQRCTSGKGRKKLSSTTAMEKQVLPLVSLEKVIWGLHLCCRMVFTVSSSLLGHPGDPGSFPPFSPSIPASFVLTEPKWLLVLSQTQTVKAIHSLLLGQGCQHPQ